MYVPRIASRQCLYVEPAIIYSWWAAIRTNALGLAAGCMCVWLVETFTLILCSSADLCTSSMASKLCSTLKTYGPKPKVFKLGEEGEEYMLGSEVGNYMRLFRGDLYKKYPGLWKRKMTQDERRHASEQIGYGYSTISSNVQIVKAVEVDDIISGNEEKYRASIGFDTVTHSSMERTPSLHHSGSTGDRRSSKKNSWISQIPSSSYHLDAVPCASPVARYKTNNKRIKSFPTW